MSFFSNLQTDDNVKRDADSVGGGGPLDSGLYNFTVSLAYGGVSDGGAKSVTVHLTTEDGRELRETVYVSSGTAKGGLNTYVDKRTGEKRYLPGFTLINDLCLLTAGKPLAEMTIEEKVVKLYNYETRSEVPTKVPVLVELLDKPIIAGVQKHLVNRRVKQGDEYVDTAEIREINELDKFFRAKDRKTVAEILAEAEEAVFIETWANKWTGQVRDRTNKDAVANVGAPGAAAANANSKPTKSLFGAA